jgi:hypothetical protein
LEQPIPQGIRCRVKLAPRRDDNGNEENKVKTFTVIRWLVMASEVFGAYAGCDDRAQLEREAYLSPFRYGDDFRQYLDENGSVADSTAFAERRGFGSMLTS